MGTKIDELNNKYGKLTVIAPAEERIRNRVCWKCKCDCGNEIIVSGTDLRQGRKKDCGCTPSPNGKDEVGNRYGSLTVIERSTKKGKNRGIYWKCKCDCGNEIEVLGSALRKGESKSCGCQKSNFISQSKFIDFTGQTFNHLTVKKFVGKDTKGKSIWLCECDCPAHTLTLVRSNDLKRTQSCGCIKSMGETKISEILANNGIIFEKEKIFSNCINPITGYFLRFDFYVDNKYVIEYDGIQHFQGWDNTEKSLKEIF